MPDRVLIVGAGPTGLTAALELSRLGTAVRIIDKQAAPHDDRWRRPLLDAPVTKWIQLAAYNTAAECEDARSSAAITVEPEGARLPDDMPVEKLPLKGSQEPHAMSPDDIRFKVIRCVPSEAVYPSKSSTQK